MLSNAFEGRGGGDGGGGGGGGVCEHEVVVVVPYGDLLPGEAKRVSKPHKIIKSDVYSYDIDHLKNTYIHSTMKQACREL